LKEGTERREMKNKALLIVLSFLVLISMVLFSCTKTTSTTQATTSSTTKPPITTSVSTSTTVTTGNWWDKLGTPVYGGTLNLQTSNLDNISLDPLDPRGMGAAYERLFTASWTVDRSVFSFQGMYIPPEYMQGWLAESWEKIDPVTIVVKLKKGVHWSNKEPTNGREFNADDVVYNYHRITGTGSGFTSPHPILGSMVAYISGVKALDKYTVEFKFKSPSAFSLYDIFAPQVNIAPPEWLKKYGTNVFTMPGPPGGGPPGGSPPPPGGGEPAPGEQPATQTTQATDWHTFSTTAAYMISDFVPSNKLTYTKVTDYYGYDERFPQNRLPYIDTINYIAIADTATALAALRTGKIDFIASGRGGGLTRSQIESLKQTNPEVNVWWVPTDGPTISLRVDKEPFKDIRVRYALSMAIDRKTIAASYYRGTIDGVPCALISPTQKGWYTPFEEWPSNIKEIYSFNPEKSKQLLTEAGYPKGFKTNIIAASNSDLQLLQIVQSQFKDIGVDMEIKVMEEFTKMDFVGGGHHDAMDWGAFTGGAPNPWQQVTVLKTGDRQNYTFNNDAKYDALYQKLTAATEEEEAKAIVKEMDLYAAEQCWMIFFFPVTVPTAVQQYVKGYQGEGNPTMFFFSRFWIDKSSKK